MPYGDPNAAWGYPVPPEPRSRTGLKIGLSIGAALVIIVGGIVGYFVIRTAATTGKYKLAMPASFQGLSQQTDNGLLKDMAGTTDGISSTGATPVLTSYSSGSVTETPQFVVVGAYGRLPLASTQIGQAWKGMTSGGGSVSDKTDEDAGPLGGSMQCGILSESGAAFGICVWADNSTYALVMDTGKTTAVSSDLPALATSTRALRAAAEIKK